MTSAHDYLADWRKDERAFEAAVTELRGPASAAGLMLRQSHYDIEGWPHVLHAEVLPRGSLQVLSCIDVGMGRHGEMLLQTIPGEARTFSRFAPHDKAFYVKRLSRLVEAALADNS